MMGAQYMLTAVKLEAANSPNGAPPPPNHNPLPTSTVLPFLSVYKPSWIVRTESNVRKEQIKKADPACVVCNGSGRIDCHNCRGKGRTNHINLAMLPKGEWPKWCSNCGGSGLGYCSRCLGTGEYRYIMGFQFMKMDGNNKPRDSKGYQVDEKQGTRSPADILADDEQLDSGPEK